MMHPVIPYVIAAVLFGLGCYGVLVRRNAVLVLMSVELMLNAVNLVLVTADTTVRATLPRTGGSFALFVIVLAAAEVGVGLAIVLQLYRLRRTVQLDSVSLAEPAGSDPTGNDAAPNDPTGNDAAPNPSPNDAAPDDPSADDPSADDPSPDDAAPDERDRRDEVML